MKDTETMHAARSDAAPPVHVLVIEDDADTRANLRDILELDDYCVETAGTLTEALRCKNWPAYAAIILDRKLPDGTAEEILPRLRQLAPQASVLIVTGYADLQAVIAALREGAADYILKPVNPDVLRMSLARIAERQKLAAEKERSDAAFRTLVEAAPCAVVIFRPNHKVIYFSPFAEEVTGYARAEVLQQDYFSVFLPEDCHPRVAETMIRAVSGAPVRGLESPIVSKDGSRRWMIWNAQCLPNYDGGPAVLAVGQDITRLKQAQDQALQSERLAAIGQMVTGLAHESGNALARSRACLEMLAWEVEDRPEAQELVTRVQKAQDQLQQLYEDLRRYAAPMSLERDTWNLAWVWGQAWQSLELARRGRQVTLSEMTGGVDLDCEVDQFRLEQVFRNIFENSLAACTDPVQIEVVCADCEIDSRPAISVRVRDNGPGLTAEQRQQIFEPFFTTKAKGTGLGMAIAKRVVEAHGGRIAAGNDSACGAEIAILLPRQAP